MLSIGEVVGGVVDRPEMTEFRPFYGLSHPDARNADLPFWHAARRSTERKDDDGTEVYLTLVDRRFERMDLGRFEVLHVRAWCSNRDLPSRLRFGDSTAADFTIEGVAAVQRVKSLMVKPTAPRRIAPQGSSRWRLVSQISLNHLALVGDPEPAGGRDHSRGPQAAKSLEALREILQLYDYDHSKTTDQRIRGLVGVDAKRVTRVLPGAGPVRGVQIDLTLDESCYVGSGAYLFAAVLDRFLAAHATINSFTQTCALLMGRDSHEAPLERWPPRTGRKPTL